jgi:IclR family KDG regulon transcriptional repressor
MDASLSSERVSGTELVALPGGLVDANGVRSVDRAAALLIALGQWDGAVGVTEVARSLNLHKSTASRLLATLQKRGLVEQDHDSGKYRLGLALIQLGGHAEKTLDFAAIAMPELMDLARSTRETVALGVLDGDSVVTLAWSSPSGVGHDQNGKYLPLHATAPGKVLLSNGPEREVIRISKPGLTPYTPRTIIRVDLLLAEVARVRERGFGTAFGEYQPNVDSIAVPVFDQRASVVAALEVRWSGGRIGLAGIPQLVERSRATAALITAHIGGVAPGRR